MPRRAGVVEECLGGAGGQPPDLLIAGRARVISEACSGGSGRRTERSVGEEFEIICMCMHHLSRI